MTDKKQDASNAEGAKAVYQYRIQDGGWTDCDHRNYVGALSVANIEARILYTAPPASDAPSAAPVSDGGDAIARSKRVLAAVDDYHEKPSNDTRHALRSLLLDEFAARHAPTGADAAVKRVEPVAVAWQFQDSNGEWCNFINEKHRQNTIAAGYKVRALYTAPPAHAAAPDVQRDAERYRHMRDRNSSLERFNYTTKTDNSASCYHVVGGVRELKSGTDLDQSIDTAIAAGKGEKA